VRVAVAPFAGESADLPVAQALAGRMARRPIDRLIAPDAFVALPEFEPRAAEIRRWAYNAAVDAIVVGRVVPRQGSSPDGGWQVDVVVRSGHSGAELARHEVDLVRPADLGASAEQLAAAILEDLGYEGSEAVEAAASDGGVSSPPPEQGGSTGGEPGTAGRGLDADLGLAGFRGDSPIEIKADEAEIIDRGERRQLVFQKNVWVRHGNVTLRSHRLEADYDKGESEPVRLVAHGAVRVEQGDRSARCDQAVYLRAENRLSCRGHAELIQGCDIVRGKSIEFDLARDQAHVEGAASIVIQPEEEGATPCEIEEGTL
jgi:lipopolysaccharide transport protein LptA